METVMAVLGGAVPAVSFCTAVPWWKWCRTTKQTKRCFLWKCW